MSDELEQELTESLKRVEAPEGFAGRVMERVATKERQQLQIVPRRGVHAWKMAVAAMLLAGISVGAVELVHREQEQQRAEVVQRQFEAAMRVTEKTLDGVSERVSKAGMKEEREGQ